MAVKFESILKSFFPKGIIWDFQDNFKKLIEGISIEFNRAYLSSKAFYDDFNIIESENLASVHALDYLLNMNLYSKVENQHIIVEYLNKDLSFEEILNDWADFIGIVIEFGQVFQPFIIGRSTTGNALGDPLFNNHRMVLYIRFISGFDEQDISKYKWLLEYLKPPYLQLVYSQVGAVENTPFYVGRNTTGNPLGIAIVNPNVWIDENVSIWQDEQLKDWTLT